MIRSLLHVARRSMPGLALALGAFATAVTADTYCVKSYGDFTTIGTTKRVTGSNFVTFRSSYVDYSSNCSGATGDFLLWGPSNVIVCFEACGTSHLYAPGYQQTWDDVEVDCDALGYANSTGVNC